jgi:uncharacterized RDD family membrane protein YckC
VRSWRGRQILTPEHVEIELLPAGLGSRFLAFVVDLTLVLAVSSLSGQLLVSLLPGGFGMVVYGILWLGLQWGYHVFFEVRYAGVSPGKRAVGLRVVDGRGLPLSLEQSFVRNALRAVDALPVGYAVGAVACLFERYGRRLGDVVADTLVVRDARFGVFDRRMAGGRAFNSLRTPRLLRLIRHRVSLEEREFLGAVCLRAPELEDRARFDLMDEVGRFYRDRLEIEDTHLSGENLVRGLAGVLFAERSTPRARLESS